jgi:hypothetical protein
MERKEANQSPPKSVASPYRANRDNGNYENHNSVDGGVFPFLVDAERFGYCYGGRNNAEINYPFPKTQRFPACHSHLTLHAEKADSSTFAVASAPVRKTQRLMFGSV